MLFSLLKHHFDLDITDTALKVPQSLYCFTTSISHGVENYFPRLWGTGISDAIFVVYFSIESLHFYPTALKGCQGIVFTHGVRMGGRAGVRAGGWAGGGK